MKKVFLVLAVAFFSLGIYASNNPLKGDNSIKEDADVKVDEEFPVYCNGVYWGTAESIDEAIWMCNYDG